jgi:hypothetical protein
MWSSRSGYRLDGAQGSVRGGPREGVHVEGSDVDLGDGPNG